MTPEAEVREAALRLLARREHARRELARKLGAKGFDGAIVEAVLGQLETERLLSDRRFAEEYACMRAGRGYGPLRIRAELGERGVAAELIDAGLAEVEQDWFELAARQRVKRFGAALPREFRERARQARFLQYRGFSADQLQAALEWDEEPR